MPIFHVGWGQLVEPPPADAQEVEQVRGEVGRGALADPDHADVRAAHDAHRQVRDLPLEGDGRDQTGAARAQHQDVFDHDDSRARHSRAVK
jgi:hypothetical protein